MLSGDGPFFAQRRDQMSKCLYQNKWKDNIRAFYEEITIKLLRQWSYKIGDKTNQVDIIRDIGNSAHTHFAANIFHLPLKTEENKHGIYTEHELYMVLAIIFVVIFFGAVDPAKTYPLRCAGLPLTQQLGALVEKIVDGISKTGFISQVVDPLREENNPLRTYGVHMIRRLLDGGLGVHETTYVVTNQKL